MMSPQDVLHATNQRSIAPRSGISPRIEGARSTRDDRRRATHNEGQTCFVHLTSFLRCSAPKKEFFCSGEAAEG